MKKRTVDVIIQVGLVLTFSILSYLHFSSDLPFVPLFSGLVLLVAICEAFSKAPLAFFMGGLVTIFGILSTNRLAGTDVMILPLLLVILWSSFSGLYWHRKFLEKNKWKSVLEKDEEAKEIKNIKQEMILYEQRLLELEKRTNQRRTFSQAARELGSLLDPGAIQARLIELTQKIFPGRLVEISFGQHADGFDRPIIQKRQPILVPSEGFRGAPLVAAPISVQRSVVGILRVASSDAGDGTAAFSRDDLRQVDGMANLASLAMDNCQLFQQVQQSALRDHLTGLYTNRVFQEKLEEGILEASRYSQPLSLVLADVDHFKHVNDGYGHQTGDLILQGFAHILDRNVRAIDLICRYGGEEFALLLYQTDHMDAVRLAEKIRMDLSDQVFDTPRGPLSVTASFGIATFSDDATSAQQLFRQADQRMYKAKSNGRNKAQGRS